MSLLSPQYAPPFARTHNRTFLSLTLLQLQSSLSRQLLSLLCVSPPARESLELLLNLVELPFLGWPSTTEPLSLFEPRRSRSMEFDCAER